MERREEDGGEFLPEVVAEMRRAEVRLAESVFLKYESVESF